ncbi:MAG TPA: M20/M25/M40 family metallo-hydrolase [Bryobacteraceae bacterium]|jgi:Iap family predicted aminopeptidase
MRRSLAPLFALTALLFAAGMSVTPYRKAADQLIQAALADNDGLSRLQYLCDRIGNRLSGSKALDQAVSWSADEMKRAGLTNVRTIPVKVPHWVRGRESVELLEPLGKPLVMLGLGGSIATPPGGITADVAVVSDFNELEILGRSGVQGKIVLYDAPFVTYGQTVTYRSQGASRAAKLGAVAALVRSITPRSLRDAHTGSTRYTDADPKIPTAAVSVEDAEYLHRLARSGQRIRVHLEMEAHSEPDADSADVMGEIVGREKPGEIVVMGGHLDSWDVGQGAHDDGGGAIAALEAVALIQKAGLRPRRTIRVVFWTNEENGARGGDAYRTWAGEQGNKHFAALEMDGGAETPVGFDLGSKDVPEDFRKRAQTILSLLKGIGADKLTAGNGEADITPLMNQGVPSFGLRTTMAHYFDYHHSQADTFDKIVPEDFRKCTAALAVMSYVLADSP